MMSIAAREPGAPSTAPGRPPEIEDPTNRYLIHPTAVLLVDRLVETKITPNQVSVSSVFASAAAALCYVGLPWPFSAFLGLVFQFIWHVLDGADGQLARRTGRASPAGELIDGVCDHVSQALIYVLLAWSLQAGQGPWVWFLAVAAGVAHFVQAASYETGRKTYRRWVYGAPWMRQTGAGVGGLGGFVSGVYLGLAALLAPGEARLEVAMESRFVTGEAAAREARRLYGETFAPLVKRSGVLDANARTILVFLCVLARRPAWFFWIELTALNLGLILLVISRGRLNGVLTARLEAMT